MSNESSNASKTSTSVKTILWMIAAFLAVSAFIYQRQTGPTYPYRGTYKIQDSEYKHKLLRSQWTDLDARIYLPIAQEESSAVLYWKRFKTEDEFSSFELKKETKDGKQEIAAYLPKQPAAGKLEYYIEIKNAEKTIRIPEKIEENIIIRFKDPVPSYVLIPHIIMMIISIFVGMRAALGAIFAADSMRLYVWIALGCMTFGGMILGPIVQKYAFGEYWTGFPFGGDWTDNKMLIMWIAWLTAGAAIGFKPKKKEGPGRVVVFIAAIVMTIVYLIPHSMKGSELDYNKVDQGIDPSKAIHTGK